MTEHVSFPRSFFDFDATVSLMRQRKPAPTEDGGRRTRRS
jgi:hypothetical protein